MTRSSWPTASRLHRRRAIRKLRTQLLGMRLPTPPKTIMVTSATDTEGKTLVSTTWPRCSHTTSAATRFSSMPTFGTRHSALVRLQSRPGPLGLPDCRGGHPGASRQTTSTSFTISRAAPAVQPVELIGSKKMESWFARCASDTVTATSSSTPRRFWPPPSQRAHAPRRRDHPRHPGGCHARETVQQAACHRGKGEGPGIVLNDLEFQSGASLSLLRLVEYYYRYRNKDNEPKNLLGVGEASSLSSRRRTELMIEERAHRLNRDVAGMSSRPRRRRSSNEIVSLHEGCRGLQPDHGESSSPEAAE